MKSNIKPQEVEVINAGKRLVRTNIVPHYLPVDESKITQIEVSNTDGEGTHLETVYPEQEIDYWAYDERVEYSSCYALLSQSDYLKLNEAISERLGFELSKSTERYTSMTSPFTTEGLMIMEITSEVQEECADLLTGLTLVDLTEITFAEEQPKIIEATGLTTQQVDWTLTHTAVTKPDLEAIYLLDSPPSPDAEQVIHQIVSQGTTVIVSDESR